MAKEYGGLIVLRDIDLTLPERGIFGPVRTERRRQVDAARYRRRQRPAERRHGHTRGEDITALPAAERFGPRGFSRTFQAVHLIPRTDGPRQRRSRLPALAAPRACCAGSSSVASRGRARTRWRRSSTSASAQLAHREVGPASRSRPSAWSSSLGRWPRSPSLLLLDEPASGLSEIQRERLREVLTAIG